jgi:hypothetical protein
VIENYVDQEIGTERRVTNPGDLAVIPGGVEHEMWCHEDIEVVDIFVPPREDFLAGGGPTWLRDEKKLRSDSPFKRYLEKYGNRAWEADTLREAVIEERLDDIEAARSLL